MAKLVRSDGQRPRQTSMTETTWLQLNRSSNVDDDDDDKVEGLSHACHAD